MDKDTRFEVLERLYKAGLKHFTLHKVEIQDEHIVCAILRIEDKEVKLTK